MAYGVLPPPPPPPVATEEESEAEMSGQALVKPAKPAKPAKGAKGAKGGKPKVAGFDGIQEASVERQGRGGAPTTFAGKTAARKKKRRRMMCAIGALVAAVLAGVAVFLVLYFTRKSSNEVAPTADEVLDGMVGNIVSGNQATMNEGTLNSKQLASTIASGLNVTEIQLKEVVVEKNTAIVVESFITFSRERPARARQEFPVVEGDIPVSGRVLQGVGEVLGYTDVLLTTVLYFLEGETVFNADTVKMIMHFTVEDQQFDMWKVLPQLADLVEHDPAVLERWIALAIKPDSPATDIIIASAPYVLRKDYNGLTEVVLREGTNMITDALAAESTFAWLESFIEGGPISVAPGTLHAAFETGDASQTALTIGFEDLKVRMVDASYVSPQFGVEITGVDVLGANQEIHLGFRCELNVGSFGTAEARMKGSFVKNEAHTMNVVGELETALAFPIAEGATPTADAGALKAGAYFEATFNNLGPQQGRLQLVEAMAFGNVHVDFANSANALDVRGSLFFNQGQVMVRLGTTFAKARRFLGVVDEGEQRFDNERGEYVQNQAEAQFEVVVATASDVWTDFEVYDVQQGVTVVADVLALNSMNDALTTMGVEEDEADKLTTSAYFHMPSFEKDSTMQLAVVADNIKVTDVFRVDSAMLAVDLAPATSQVEISAEAILTWDLPGEDRTLRAQVTGSYVAQPSMKVDVTGELLEPWNKPFGADYINIHDAKLTATLERPAGAGTPLSYRAEFDAQVDFTHSRYEDRVDVEAVLDGANFHLAVRDIDIRQTDSVWTRIFSGGDISVVFTNYDWSEPAPAGSPWPMRDHRTGMTIYADFISTDSGALGGSISALSEDATHHSWYAHMFLPILGGNAPWEVYLHAPRLEISKKVAFLNSSLLVEVGRTGDYAYAELTSTLYVDWSRNRQTSVATFGSYDTRSKLFRFTATMPEWQNVLDLDFIDLSETRLEVYMDHSEATPMRFLALDTMLTLSAGSGDPIQVACMGGIFDENLFFIARAVEGQSLADMACNIFGGLACQFADNEYVQSLPLVGKPLDIAVSTAHNLRIPREFDRLNYTQAMRRQSQVQNDMANLSTFRIGRGLSLFTDSALDGPIFQAIAGVFGDRIESDLVVRFSTLLPVFILDVEDDDFGEIEIRFQMNGFRVTDAVHFTGIEVYLAPFQELPEITLSAEISVQFPKNPGLVYFGVSGKLTAVGITIGGYMQGRWENAFGLETFTIEDAAIEITISPGPVVSGVGVTCTMFFGEIQVMFAGKFSADGLDAYLEARIENMSMRNVASFYNTFAPSAARVRVDSVPELFDFNNLHVLFAPKAGRIQGITFKAGFRFDADIVLFGSAHVSVSLRSERTSIELFGAPVPMIDFRFDMRLPVGEIVDAFFDFIDDFLPFDLGIVNDVLDVLGRSPLGRIFSIQVVHITDLSLLGLANGELPDLMVQLYILGDLKTLYFTADLDDLVGSFKEILRSLDVSSLLPECIIDKNCPRGDVCDHTKGWTCRSSCGFPKISILGTGCW